MADASECEAHIPHKQWSRDTREFKNYTAIEQWSRQLHDSFTPGSVHIPLLIPAKGWSGDRFELENYLAIERWSRLFQVNCIASCCC